MVTGSAFPILYKGAGPGTHWHSHDPRSAFGGFTAGLLPSTPNAVIRHITNYSFPSAYLSFSTSFAIARGYALDGPAGIATASSPGYVYEIDLSALMSPPSLVDPVHTLSSPVGAFAHNHNGSDKLVAEIAGKATTFSQAHQCGGSMLSPAVNSSLRALIFAIRDAEVFIGSNVLSGAIINRHNVF